MVPQVVYDPKRRCFVPRDIAFHAAGEDAYLREIKVACASCRSWYVLKDSDSAMYCQDCIDKQGLENEKSDHGG